MNFTVYKTMCLFLLLSTRKNNTLKKNRCCSQIYFCQIDKFGKLNCYKTNITWCKSFTILNLPSLWAGTSRPIIWNKNLRRLCVSAGWMYNLRVYIYNFNGQLIMHMILYFLCTENSVGFFLTFVVPLCCVTHVTCFLYRSLCMLYL